jgi:hypothetical protein
LFKKKNKRARHQWLMAVILATGETDQEDYSLKPAQTNSPPDSILKNPYKNRACRVAQNERPEFKPQYGKINK